MIAIAVFENCIETDQELEKKHKVCWAKVAEKKSDVIAQCVLIELRV